MSSEVRVPRGLQLGAVRAGIKASGNLDVALAVADGAASAAAMFTQNQFCAAPVTIGRTHLSASGGKLRAVLINAGNANCATGEAGLNACRKSCLAVAAAVGCDANEVFPSSTGIIGVPLPVESLTDAIAPAMAQLGRGAEHVELFSRAIITTDTVPKVEARSLTLAGREVRILGFAKGAGMIHPQLGPPHATMLVYLFTDLGASPAELRELLHPAAERSFNSISIDGDTSTNDTVLLVATSACGVSYDELLVDEKQAFASELYSVCEGLAKRIVRDGEGAKHLVEIHVSGARSVAEARTIAKLLAHSPLVKTAWAGEDPNWGRLVSAIGAGPVAIDTQKLRLAYGRHPVFENGGRAAAFDADAIHAYLQQAEYSLQVSLGLGDAETCFWTCDLTAEYVRINADYST